jgi:predicted ABC-type ATPase
MRISELKSSIREMIVNELTTPPVVVDKNSIATDIKGKNPETVIAAIAAAKQSNKPVTICRR